MKKDLESPYRKYIISTDLRSDLNKPSKYYRLFQRENNLYPIGTAGSKRSFLRGGFPTLMGLGFGPQAGQGLSSIG